MSSVRPNGPTRRTALRAPLAALGAALALPGCGFALRQPPTLPWRRLALRGFAPRSPMADALRQALPAEVRWVQNPAEAELVIHALEDRLHRTAVSSTAAGLVRELRLRVVLKLRLQRPDGTLLLPDTELEQSRDMSYNESSALAKEAEENVLVREMRADIARQVLRLLAAAHPAAA